MRYVAANEIHPLRSGAPDGEQARQLAPGDANIDGRSLIAPIRRRDPQPQIITRF
jgi:hypothetical protein